MTASFLGHSSAENHPKAMARDLPAEYPSVLSLRGVPSAAEDWGFAPFSDQGAWFGFAVPPEDRPDLRGGFTGPFLMPEGRWISPQLAALELKDLDDGMTLSWESATAHQAAPHPGSLRREMIVGELIITQELWFDSAHTAFLLTGIRNSGGIDRSLELAWTGTVFEGALMAPAEYGILARSTGGATVVIRPEKAACEIKVAARSYRITQDEPLTVSAGDSVSVALAMTCYLAGDTAPNGMDDKIFPGLSWSRNLQRWNQYLTSVTAGVAKSDSVELLAVKSLMTLVNNWRAPAGRMRFSSLFPSSNVRYFNGFWAWDSWKHAVGVLQFDPELAKDQVRAMFDHQNDRGMIADVVYLDEKEDNWRDTKPPLAGWAIQEIYEATGDLEFVRELYPGLVEYHVFWYTDRDHDRDGLCEYGSTDGTLEAARWESGMDNAVRFDTTSMLENGPGAWSMDQESVDLNSYLYREKLALAVLAQAQGLGEESIRWYAEARILKERIRGSMFDEETGWFYDIAIDTGQAIPVQGPEGWIPLWAGAASQEQAARASETILDPGKFNTHVPFPTVAADSPEFSDGYWRGSVWLDQVYFGIEGLRRYGFAKESDILVEKLFNNLEGAVVAGEPLRENYNPLTGAGQNVRHFSWTAAHLLLMTRPGEQKPPVLDHR